MHNQQLNAFSPDDLLKFKLSFRVGIKGDLSDFKYGIAVGISKKVYSTISIFTENSLKRREYPVSSSYQGENTSFLLEVRGKWPECFELIKRQQ